MPGHHQPHRAECQEERDLPEPVTDRLPVPGVPESLPLAPPPAGRVSTLI
jgi:hypothetical protein